jgi:hypothetical protein
MNLPSLLRRDYVAEAEATIRKTANCSGDI